MTGPDASGRREQHKARTRAAIRAAALELISRQGYQTTTAAQIAQAAGVSHTTLFRYFESKDAVLITDDLDEDRRRATSQIPPGLDRFELVRRLVTDLFTIAQADAWASDPERHRLLRGVPELRTAHLLEADRMIQEATDFIAEYTGTERDSLPLRVFIAALSGVMMHLVDHGETPDESTLAESLVALDLLEHGLPLN